jgi:type IV secretory pathway VirJ component
MNRMALRIALAAMLGFGAMSVAVGMQAQSATADLSQLPLTEMRASPDTSNVLVIFLTGDGGWASIDKQVTAEIRAHGVDVVGLNTRPYLGRKKTPAEIAFDLTRIARHYMTAWNRSRLAIVGYSRGADLMPFGVTGMPADLRDKTVLLAFLGLATRAGFEFHFADIMFNVKRDSDQPTLPTLAQLKGMKMLCIYGAEEDNSACRAAPPGLITRTVQLPGGHHYDSDYKRVGDLVLEELRSAGTLKLPAQH